MISLLIFWTCRASLAGDTRWLTFLPICTPLLQHRIE